MPTQDWMGFRPNGYEGQNSLDEEVFTNNEGGILPPRVFTEADQLLDGPSRFFEVHTLLAALVSKPAYSVIRFAEPEQLRQYIGRTMVWLGNLIMMLTHGTLAVSGEVHTDTLLHAAILKTQITPGFSQIISESNETPLEALVHISTVGAVFQQWERLGPTLSPGLFGIYSYFVEALEDKEVLITENDQEE